jgi:hypothetical protein
MYLTRRRAVAMLGSVAAVAMMPLRSFAKAAAQPAIQPKQPSLKVIGSNDPAFAALLEQNFPSLNQHHSFAKLQPAMAIVQNTGRVKVRAFALRWTLVNPDGTSKELVRRYMRGAARIPTRRVVTGQATFLRPGEFAVATPLFSYSSATYQRRGGKLNLSMIAPQQRKARSFVRKAANASATTVGVDGVISRRMVAQESSRNLARHYTIYRNAEHDEAISLLASDTSGNNLLQLIEEHIVTGKASGDRGFKGIYGRARTRYALKLRRLVNVKGSAKALEVLQKVSGLKRTLLARA